MDQDTGRPRPDGALRTRGGSRRTHLRVECDLAVGFHLRGTGESGRARMADIGLGGARVDLPVPVRIPETVDLTLDIQEAAPLQLSGRVVWTVDGSGDGRPSWPTGLQFQTLEDSERRRLHRLVTGLLEPRPVHG